MKLSAFGLLCLVPAVCAAAENPVFLQQNGNITFHVSFDRDNMEPDLASGDWKIARELAAPEFVPGVFGGRALKKGCSCYWTKDNFNPNESGTLVAWVSPLNWPEKAPDALAREPGFGVFGAGLVLGKQHRQNWGKSTLNITAQYSKYSRSVHISSAGNTTQWKNGEWHLLVAVWDLGTLGLSVDGAPPRFNQIPEKAPNHSIMRIGNAQDLEYFVAIDEVTILNRALQAEEIRNLYEASRTLMQDSGAGKQNH